MAGPPADVPWAAQSWRYRVITQTRLKQTRASCPAYDGGWIWRELGMVTGSIAASYYAVPRMTRDIDLVVEPAAADADRLCALFGDDFYVDRDAVREAIAWARST